MLTHSFSVWKVFIHLCIISDVELCLINFHLSLIDGIDMKHWHVRLLQRISIQSSQDSKTVDFSIKTPNSVT